MGKDPTQNYNSQRAAVTRAATRERRRADEVAHWGTGEEPPGQDSGAVPRRPVSQDASVSPNHKPAATYLGAASSIGFAAHVFAALIRTAPIRAADVGPSSVRASNVGASRRWSQTMIQRSAQPRRKHETEATPQSAN